LEIWVAILGLLAALVAWWAKRKPREKRKPDAEERYETAIANGDETEVVILDRDLYARMFELVTKSRRKRGAQGIDSGERGQMLSDKERTLPGPVEVRQKVDDQ